MKKSVQEKAGLKFVIADDHTMLRELLAEMLVVAFGDGTQVSECTSFADLFELAPDSGSPDVILLDLSMPGATPEQGVSKAVERFPQSKVLVFSGSADPALARKVLELGAAGFVPKTVSRRSIANAIRVVLDGEKYIHQFALESDLPRAQDPAQNDAPESRAFQISDREQEIVNCLVEGRSNKDIARRLDLQEMTVKTHLRNIYRKLGAQNRADAVARVLRANRQK